MDKFATIEIIQYHHPATNYTAYLRNEEGHLMAVGDGLTPSEALEDLISKEAME